MHFRPMPLLTVLTLAALAFLLTLGVWQSQRMAWKEAELARWQEASANPARDLDEALCVDAPFEGRAVGHLPEERSGNVRVYGRSLDDNRPGWRIFVPVDAPACLEADILLAEAAFQPLMEDSAPIRMIGRWRIELETDVPGEIMRAFEGALETLRALGARIVDARLRRYEFGKTRREGLLISEYEGHAIHAKALSEAPEGFSPSFAKMLAWGAKQSEARYREALTALDVCGLEAAQTFTKVDFVVSPTALETAFRFGDPVPAGQADLTAFANFAGIPATSVPMGLSAEGLPLGLQIMAGAGRDYAAMALAAAFEARRGPLKPG